MPNPTRDEIKKAAEAIIRAFAILDKKESPYAGPGTTLTLANKVARALLSAFEREEKMLGILKYVRDVTSSYSDSPWIADMHVMADAAIKAAEEGR